MKLIAFSALLLAIFGDVTPGSGHLLAIVSSVLAAFCFAGAPIISVIAVGANAMAVTLPTPQLVIYDLLHYSSVASRMVDAELTGNLLGKPSNRSELATAIRRTLDKEGGR